MTRPELAERRQLAAGDVFLHTRPDDALARLVLADLEREYDARYGNRFGEPASTEINRYPVRAFSAPEGTFLLLLRDGVPISAGAFMTIDAQTVEFKRMWTDARHRGQHLAALVLRELEDEARRRGFTRVVLSTGPRQPEAVALYLREGFTPLFDPADDPEIVVFHRFTKDLVGLADAEGRTS